MGKFLDSIAVWFICVAFAAALGISEYSVVGMLVALIVMCLCLVVSSRPLRLVVLGALAVACLLGAWLLPYLPILACLCAFERRGAAQLLWVVPLVLAFPPQGRIWFVLLAVCCASALIGWVITSESIARVGALNARDGIRETVLRMGDAERAVAVAEDAALRETPSDPFEDLTDRERQVAELVAQGFDNKQIAAALFLSEGTVRNNISTILAKKQLQNRTQLAILALTA